MKYYFISYAWRNYRQGYTCWNLSEKVTEDEHPVDWMIGATARCQEQGVKEEYRIIFWSEITKEQYKKWKGKLG